MFIYVLQIQSVGSLLFPNTPLHAHSKLGSESHEKEYPLCFWTVEEYPYIKKENSLDLLINTFFVFN